MLFLGCPKDRTGVSGTSDLLESTKEIESLMLKINAVEQRISQIENITQARGQQDIMKMESMDQVRVELANMRGELEQAQFMFEEVESTVQGQAGDVQFRLDWLEGRTTDLEATLGLSTPPPSSNNNVSVQSLSSESGSTPDSPITNSSTAPSDKVNSEQLNTKVETTENNNSPVTTNEVVTPPSANELLILAKQHLVDGREEAADAVLQRILKEFPRTAIEDEVRYRLAEASFNKGNFVEAARRFQDVIQRFPNSPFAPWSLLRQGECFEEIGQEDNAKVFYQSVIDEYPNSKAAKEATGKIE
jgi:tol-pal system protein YbgF